MGGPRFSEVTPEALAAFARASRVLGDAFRRQAETFTRVGEAMARAVASVEVVEDGRVPPGRVVVLAGGGLAAHPWTAAKVRLGGRTPGWSEWTVGQREVERDRRRGRRVA